MVESGGCVGGILEAEVCTDFERSSRRDLRRVSIYCDFCDWGEAIHGVVVFVTRKVNRCRMECDNHCNYNMMKSW